MSPHDPSPALPPADSPGAVPPVDSPDPFGTPEPRRSDTRSIAPGLTLFCLNLALGAILVIMCVWPGVIDFRSPLHAAPSAAPTSTLSAPPGESLPAVATAATITSTVVPVTPTTPNSSTKTHPNATATPTLATPIPTPTSIAPMPTPTSTFSPVG